MMNSRKKISPHFFAQVERFMVQANLFPEPQGNSKAFVAVSGGKDSMALLYFLKELKKRGAHPLKELVVLHVNHGVRVESLAEEAMVRAVCDEWKIPCLVKKLNFLSAHYDQGTHTSNFENEARKLRYQWFAEVLSQEQTTKHPPLLYMGHHLDDSFEWSLMQQWKNSSLRPCLGIAVRSYTPSLQILVARPFLSVSSQQIQRFLDEINQQQKIIPYCFDQSNFDTRFERNFLRLKIIPQIKKKFPGYLKHYVDRANQLAKLAGVSVFMQHTPSQTYSFHIDPGGLLMIFRGKSRRKDFLHEAQVELKVEEVIKNLSTEGRGVLRLQIHKLLQAQSQGKTGPMVFSGGVQCFMLPRILAFIGKRDEALQLQRDEHFFLILQKIDQLHQQAGPFRGDLLQRESFFEKKQMNFHQWVESFLPFIYSLPTTRQCEMDHDQHDFSFHQTFPFWLVSKREELEHFLPSLKKAHPLWPNTTKFIQQKGWWYRSSFEFFHQGMKLRREQKDHYTFTFYFLKIENITHLHA